MPDSAEKGVNVTINFVTKQKGNKKMKKAINEATRELNNKHFLKMLANDHLIREMRGVEYLLEDYLDWGDYHCKHKDFNVLGDNGELITKANALRLALSDFTAYAEKIGKGIGKLSPQLGDKATAYADFYDYCSNHSCSSCPFFRMKGTCPDNYSKSLGDGTDSEE